MPGARSWVNRFGDTTTFDDLAIEMINRPFAEASCGGTHYFYSLSQMIRVDARFRIFSEQTRRLVIEHLQKIVDVAAATQHSDGSWSAEWNRNIDTMTKENEKAVSDSSALRVLLTGHMIEAMAVLPPEITLPEQTMRRAAIWLANEISSLTPDDFWRDVCPYTHAICVVKRGIDSGNAGLSTNPHSD